MIQIRRLLGVTLILALCLTMLGVQSCAAQKSSNIPDIGLNINTRWDYDLRGMIAPGGFTGVRLHDTWDVVEKQKGVLAVNDKFDREIRELAGQGVKPLVILAYGNSLYTGAWGNPPKSAEQLDAYANYVRFMVNKYKDITNLW